MEDSTKPKRFKYRKGKLYFSQGTERRILFYFTLALMIAGLVYMIMEL